MFAVDVSVSEARKGRKLISKEMSMADDITRFSDETYIVEAIQVV